MTIPLCPYLFIDKLNKAATHRKKGGQLATVTYLLYYLHLSQITIRPTDTF